MQQPPYQQQQQDYYQYQDQYQDPYQEQYQDQYQEQGRSQPYPITMALPPVSLHCAAPRILPFIAHHSTLHFNLNIHTHTHTAYTHNQQGAVYLTHSTTPPTHWQQPPYPHAYGVAPAQYYGYPNAGSSGTAP